MKNRYFNTHFWDDNYIVGLSPTEKLLFIYLFTNPLTNIGGIYEIGMSRISFDTGLTKEAILKALKGFQISKKCFYNEGWIILPNFIKHQTPNTNIIKGIEDIFSKIPANVITSDIYDSIEKALKGFERLSNALNYLNLIKLNLNLDLIEMPEKIQAETTKIKFIKPSITEIENYAFSIDFKIDGEKFFNYYESQGWLIGKNPMKNWKAAVVTWKKNNINRNGKTTITTVPTNWDEENQKLREMGFIK